jgi:hypothetical protein
LPIAGLIISIFTLTLKLLPKFVFEAMRTWPKNAEKMFQRKTKGLVFAVQSIGPMVVGAVLSF